MSNYNSADLAEALSAAAVSAENAAILKARTPKQRSVVAYFEETIGGCLSNDTPISETDYDAMVAARIKAINSREQAMERLGISPEMVQEANPILLGGYDYDGSRYVRQGNDEKWRASSFEITWVFCGDEQLYTYTAGFETFSNRTWNEAHEYFYKDITDVKHTNEKCEKIRKVRMNRCLSLIIKPFTFGLVSGSSVKIETVDYSSFRINTKAGTSLKCTLMKNDAVERSIQGLKTKIREKKFA